MVFLNPAVLFGLLAASIPVLIHLINLRKLNKIEFSTLAFLKELQKTKIKKVKLKQWILLALRVLIILFLVASFARPTIESVSLAGISSSAKTSSVIIVDNSFSMSVVTENGSYLNQAKFIIKSILNEFEEGDEVLIIPASSLEKEDKTFSRNRAQIEGELESIEISEISNNLNSAILNAGELLKESNNFNKELYLFTDFQNGNFVNNKKEISETINSFGDDVKLYMFDFSGKDINNVSITDFKINNQIFQKGKPVSFSATITNYGKTAQRDVVASLFINGNRTAQSNIDLQPDASKIINLETTLNETGLLEIFVELEDDEILQDNKRYTAINIPKQIEIAIFSDNAANSNFIELALNGNSSDGNFSFTKRVTTQLTSLNLNNYDVIFLVAGEKNVNLKRLTEYMNNGGELIVMPSANAGIAGYSSIMRALGLNGSVKAIGKMNELTNYYSFENIDLEHPLFFDMFEEEAKGKIESPDIFYYLQVNPAGRGKTIISMTDNSAFLSEYLIGNGKALVFNTAPVLSWSSFPLKGVFAPLLNRSIYYLISEASNGKSAEAGSRITVPLAGQSIRQLRVAKPKGREEFLNLDTLTNKRIVNFEETGLAGIYKFYSDEKLIDYQSVNVNPNESVTNYLGEDEIENYLTGIGYKGIFYFIDPADDYNSVIYQARFGTELWRLFLIIAFLLALIEMAVAKSSKKDIVEIS